jgi:hypothetical protein
MKNIRRIKSKQQHNKDNKPPPPIKYLFWEKKEGLSFEDVVTGDPGAGVVVTGVVVTGDPGAGVVVPGAGDPPPPLEPCVCFASHVCVNEPTELIFALDKSTV